MSDQKFCFSCGQKMPASASFCPNCGQRQPQFQAAVPATPAAVITPTVPVPPVTPAPVQSAPTAAPQAIDLKNFGKALDIDAVNRYRQALGYTSPDNLIIWAQHLPDMKMYLLLGAFSYLTSKQYMISFEDDGILFLGFGLTYFDGKNAFINFNDVKKLSFKNIGIAYHLTVATQDSKMKVQVNRFIMGHPWQAANVKILAQRYHK
ncbi:zinc ribbon domain-containing protein [Levilactobacillus humaensis]|uniref:zinc ribbon domain-containing protein n=1 Tax=Levilactobacillus humaensis TaxID=2950375 RepID=UPI0021C4C0E0|nr:zinc ribbon domain-containing protein [Levilactobacillus humaensis]